MSNNLPPDFRDDTRDHYPRCASLCEYADTPLDIDKGIDLFMAVTADLSYWKPAPHHIIQVEVLAGVQRRLNEAAAYIECLNGHRDHSCMCEDIANSDDPWDEGD